MAQALLNALHNETNCDELFGQFPHAFAAMLLYFAQVIGQKPKVLCDAQLFLIEEGTEMSLPQFAVVSIIFVAMKTGNKNVIEFINRFKGDDWRKYCVFFTVCFHHYQKTVEMLNGNKRLFRFLREGVREETAFVGAGKWGDSLIEFALFCAHGDIAFEERSEWRTFLERVRIADWPDALQVDHENLRLLDRYLARFA